MQRLVVCILGAFRCKLGAPEDCLSPCPSVRLARSFRLTLLVAVACCLGVMPAWAMNVDGKFGLGFEETLTGVGVQQSLTLDDHSSSATPLPDLSASGLAARYYYGNVGFELIVGAGLHHPKGADWEYSLLLSPGIFYNVFRAPSVNLSLGARFLNGWSRFNTATGTLDDSDCTAGASPETSSKHCGRYGFSAEIPLRVEYFFSPAFAISGAVGPVLTYNPGKGNPLTGNTNSLDVTFTRGGFSGGIGFTYFLN